ncbi:hypothetical protein JAAARDRAFT_35936 [Jaapia argillacea MUCL 33604]|uniref:Methylosome subunit pICln n=1 Tax=Jaapia argillacea MUCL 33604 TaxID=933084 RepID=A0A067PR55_9AGAM|nr:hypothetical protein JAAARDRAFT_35936 [Jaapia argillacea MUCL 33604]
MPAVTLTSTIPKFISPEEHKTLVTSTPASFSDIPPVLRHQEHNVSITLEPPVEGFSPEDAAQGTLYVIESVLVFMSTSGKGFQVEYPSITLHAISRAESGPSIYCQLDDGNPAAHDAPTVEDEVDEMRELNIVPQNPSALESIFEALSICASLHPDPNQDDDMDEDDDAFIDAGEGSFEVFTGTEGEELSEVGRVALEHLESIIYDPFQQPESGSAEAEAEAEEESHEHHVNGVNGDAQASEGEHPDAARST